VGDEQCLLEKSTRVTAGGTKEKKTAKSWEEGAIVSADWKVVGKSGRGPGSSPDQQSAKQETYRKKKVRARCSERRKRAGKAAFHGATAGKLWAREGGTLLGLLRRRERRGAEFIQKRQHRATPVR